MRPGVILCKLGNWYAPEVLPLRKIYDVDGLRLEVRTAHAILLFSLSLLFLFLTILPFLTVERFTF